METHLLGKMFPGTRDELIVFMESVGYTHIKDAHQQTNDDRAYLGTTDDLFVKNEMLNIKEEL